MFGQRLARILAESVNEVPHPFGQARLIGYLDEETRRERR